MNPTTTDAVLPDDALAAFAVAIGAAIAERYPQAAGCAVAFEAPRNASFGDAATNVAFSLAKVARAKPQDVAATLIDDAREREPRLANLFASIEPVAGFINLRIAPACWQALVARILAQRDAFGTMPSNGIRISLEFGSANPTGPLVVVQGRTLSIGDVIAKALRFCGYDVFTEWIINDAGGQVDTLGRSLYARYRQRFDSAFQFPEEGYPGGYLLPLAERIADVDGDKWVDAAESGWLPHFSAFGRDALVAQQRVTAKRFGVDYDLWQSEQELYDGGHVKAGLAQLAELGLTYEQDGAVFFKATEFGDDKDRVLVRADGRPTYVCADVAYHYEKLQRADRAIDILGPDHHGYIGRIKGVAAALGYPGKLDVVIAQQITLLRGSEQVSMSKRAGDIVTLDEILDEVGIDAARFFFVMLANDSPLTFDLALAKEKSLENPVYYVQYGHTRIAGVLRNAAADDVDAAQTGDGLQTLSHPAELALARRLSEFPRVVQGVAEHEAPHRLARYARDVATDFHQFYTECRILVDDAPTRRCRLALCIAAKSILARVLAMLGVTAPETM
ncbi:MAG TPA: arginine--tRNA ligase [Verrucomicrobiae bacterium]|jgi:arginyl-tRNA synthetase|nr:arginine--tRNA ligase [Verrucomicrobiae bacterium]